MQPVGTAVPEFDPFDVETVARPALWPYQFAGLEDLVDPLMELLGAVEGLALA